MAKASGLTQNAIGRIWRACGLKPHLQENFKLSTELFFVEKVRDIVGLYLNPPEQTRAMVLCVNEKSPIQALDRRCKGLVTAIKADLAARGLLLREGTLIAAPSPTPNQKTRHPEMHQTRKGNR